MGEIAILNVGTGDTKLTFDKNNPAETIRAGRIVTDMLRRGYALLIQVDDGKGGVTHHRVKRFDEKTSEYIIADFDPVEAARTDEQERAHAEVEEIGNPTPSPSPGEEAPAPKRRGRPAGSRKIKDRAIPASGVKGTAIARSAGG